MADLEQAIALAVQAHHGQVDKAGQPYILHPLRLMMQMHSDPARMAAVLHDVVEDTDVTLTELKAMGFPEKVIETVDLLTHPTGLDYVAYMQRLAPSPLARRIKLADLEDNMDVRRLNTVTERDADRLKRYRYWWQWLKELEADME